MKVIKDVIFYDDLALDIYLPENQKNPDFLVYFHGGGIECGAKDDINIQNFAKSFTDKGLGFVSANYHLYPNTKFPLFLKEAAQAIKYVFENISQNIYVSGQSAGAYMISMLCFDKHYLSEIGVDHSKIKGWISDSGQMTSHFNVISKEDGIHPLTQRIDERAPLYFVSENATFSRLLLIYYTNDMPSRPEQNRLMYSAIKNFNPNADIELVELPGEHCHGSSYKDPDGEYAYVKETLKFILK